MIDAHKGVSAKLVDPDVLGRSFSVWGSHVTGDEF
jgi:hypothetical protein